MKILKKALDNLSSRAQSLESLGLQGVAWSKSDALELLTQLEGSAVAVLGGDVYSISADRLKPSYENWFCERLSREDLPSYAARSQQVAVAFLRDFPDLPGVRFTLALSQDETVGL